MRHYLLGSGILNKSMAETVLNLGQIRILGYLKLV